MDRERKDVPAAFGLDAGDLSTRVFSDEPILFTAEQLRNFTPPECRQMRNMVRKLELYGAPDAEIFYAQAKFMENYTDDFAYNGTFFRYFPTYQAMSDAQLRGYFSWRTRVRRGVVEPTSLSFAFVYLYELVNLIGVRSAAEGYEAIRAFGEAYGAFEPKIKRYVCYWLKDFVVYYGLDPALLSDQPDVAFERDVLTLLRYGERTDDEIFGALRDLSTYSVGNSGFYKKYPDDVKTVAARVYAALSAYYEKNRKFSLCEHFFGRMYESPYPMFRSAVFRFAPHTDCVYEVNEIHRYFCKSGQWSCERFYRYGRKNSLIGTILKNVDFALREAFGYKSSLKREKAVKLIDDLIDREVAAYAAAKRLAARPKIEIDLSKLGGIRRAAEATESRLVVPDEPSGPEGILFGEGALPDPPAPAPKADYARTDGPADKAMTASLSGEAVRLLTRLLSGKRAEQAAGRSVTLLVDEINDALYERFNDTVIEFFGDEPRVIEDYEDELRGMIE